MWLTDATTKKEDEVEIDSDLLCQSVYIHRGLHPEDDENLLVIRCNYCVSTAPTATFFSGNFTSAPSSNWMARAAIHLKKYHLDLLKEGGIPWV